jgi:hypothetical protein
MSVPKFLQRPGLARFPFVFIVTFGRSGSTLLQGILNSIPGYLIRGENNSTLLALFVAVRQYQQASGYVRDQSDPTHPWFGAEKLVPRIFSESVADLFLNLCLQPETTTRCIGFKEIRYTPEEIPDELFTKYLEFIQIAFPKAALIFNVRSVTEAMDSGWWVGLDRGPTKYHLEATIERFELYAAEHANCFVFNYDSLIKSPAYCEGLFGFLGEPLDLDRIKAVLAQPHSYGLPKRADLTAELEAKSVELALMRKRARQLEALIDGLRKSTTWKVTWPLRRMRLLFGMK